MKKRLVAALLAVCLIGVSLSGCGSSDSSSPTITEDGTATAVDNMDRIKDTDIPDVADTNRVSLMNQIDTYMAGNGDMGFTYTDTMYGLDEDYVFEFDACDEAGSKSFDAFCVYVSEDDMQEDIDCMATNGYHSSGYYCDSSFEDGKIKVSPTGVIRLAGVYEADPDSDPTWGVYNKLFLAQWMNLETGEMLDEPLVTIFSVNHFIDAPVVTQKLDETNNYTLTWNPVAGATEYSVFSMLDDQTFSFEGTTTDTTISVNEFQSEIDTVSMLSSFSVDDTGAIFGMNYSIHSDVEHGYKYVVVAKTDAGISGISNIIDPADIAGTIPYTTVSGKPTYDIMSVNDAPLYSYVTMADDTDKLMMINYHGAHVYELEDGTVHVSTKFLNTDLACIFDITGVDFATFTGNKDVILAKQDSENQTGGSIDPTNNISEVPTFDEDEKDEIVEQLIEENDMQVDTSASDGDDDSNGDIVEPDGDDDSNGDIVEPDDDDNQGGDTPDSVDPDDDDDNQDGDTPDPVEPADNNQSGPSPTVTPGGYSTNELYNAALDKINETYSEYGIDINDISTVLYANSKLEAYLGYALMARLEIIPVPTDVFPEATNTRELSEIVWAVYRQNPTSGFIYNYDYSYDYQAVIIYYGDDTDTRLRQTKEELETAKAVAASVVDSSMTTEEKVYAFNDYFCERASYDFDSLETDISDLSNLPQDFIDSHTPYGILCNDYGVCESYSEAFALVARMSGLNVIMETGSLNGGPHEWNKVCIDGQYYIVDITNNDRLVSSNSLLLVSEKQASSLSGDTSSYLINAKATDDSKEYYANTIGLIYSKEEAVKELEKMLDENKVGNIRVGFDASDEEFIDILKTIYTDGYDILNANNVFNNVIGVAVD